MGQARTRLVRDSLFGVTVARSALPTADALQSRSRYGLPANSCPVRPLRPSRKWPTRRNVMRNVSWGRSMFSKI